MTRDAFIPLPTHLGLLSFWVLGGLFLAPNDGRAATVLKGSTSKPVTQPIAAAGSIIHPLQLTQSKTLDFGKVSLKVATNAATIRIPAAAPSTPVLANAVIASPSTATPAIFTLTGEPRRAYTLTAPSSVLTAPGNHLVTSLTFWTQSGGSGSGTSVTGTLRATGTDTLRIGATLTLPKGVAHATYTATVPITVAYQ